MSHELNFKQISTWKSSSKCWKILSW